MKPAWILSLIGLCLALSGAARMPIEPHVVRHWEEGQPPKSTEELEALCAVMRKHGLFPLDIEEFRQPIVRVSFVLPTEYIGGIMKHAKALNAFKRYLQLKPDAPDADEIQDEIYYLEQE